MKASNALHILRFFCTLNGNNIWPKTWLGQSENFAIKANFKDFHRFSINFQAFFYAIFSPCTVSFWSFLSSFLVQCGSLFLILPVLAWFAIQFRALSFIRFTFDGAQGRKIAQTLSIQLFRYFSYQFLPYQKVFHPLDDTEKELCPARFDHKQNFSLLVFHSVSN